MNPTRWICLPLAAALTLSGHASVTDHFESYVLGSALAGQGAWQGWGNDNTGASAYISADHAASGSQSVMVSENADQVLTLTGMTSGQWVVRIKQYIPSSSSGVPSIWMFNKYMPDGDDNTSIRIQCDMFAGRMIDDLGGSAQIAMVRDAWVEWRFEIDLAANTVTTYYNHSLFTTHPWKGGAGTLELAALELYASACSPIYFDDVSVAPAVTSTHGDRDSWAASFGSGFTDTAPGADPDGDGMTNQQEYAFGLNPALGSSVNPITSPFNKGTRQFTYTRRLPSLTGLVYTYQYSTDLSGWSEFTPDASSSNSATPIEAVTVTVPATQTAAPKLFVRVAAQ